MKHDLTITTSNETWTGIVADDTGYGRRVNRSRTVYGYECSCGLEYDAYEGASSRSLARLIAKEAHEDVEAVA